VASILILILSTDLFIVILGWDGLGITSFFLIIYYNSGSTLFSGVFTFIINRIGDGVLVFVVVLSRFYLLSTKPPVFIG